MRKLVLIAVLVLITAAYAAPRKVLFEEFTRVSG